jgi:hypothetical protein
MSLNGHLDTDRNLRAGVTNQAENRFGFAMDKIRLESQTSESEADVEEPIL